MSRLYRAGDNAWQPNHPGITPPDPPPPPTPTKFVRVTYVGATADTSSPPTPTPTATMFGFNYLHPVAQRAAAIWGVVPISRCYNEFNAFGTSGALFNPGGLAYRAAAQGVAGITGQKRVNMSFKFDPTTITSASSPKAVEMRNFAQLGVPAGWTVQLVMHHEWNLHMQGSGGDGATAGTAADFIRAHQILSDAIVTGSNLSVAAGRGKCIPVINPASSALTPGTAGDYRNVLAAASTCADGTQLFFDVYNNPNGQPGGYKNYGCIYRDVTAQMDDLYAMVVAKGYNSSTYGWGMGEMGAPRRVGPRLATLDPTLGWGPQSPFDLDGSGQAQAITEYCNYALNAPVPASTVLLFLGDANLASANWNQDFWTAGSASKDAPAGNPNRQGWPINVDPTQPLNAYKAFLNITA